MALLLFGCARDSHSVKVKMISPYLSGNLKAARLRATEKRAKGPSCDRIIDALEVGYLDFLSGDFEGARNAFVYAEQQSFEMEDRAIVSATDVSRNILSTFTNLSKLEYRAKCNDQIMLHIYKALSYLGMGMAEAYDTEIFPLHQTMQDIEEKHMKVFLKEQDALKRDMQNTNGFSGNVDRRMAGAPDINALVPNSAVRNFLNPLALLMAGVARAEAQDWENAKVDFNKLFMAMPNSVLAGQLKREVLRRENAEIPPALSALPELAFNPNGGNVLVVLANGRGAALEQRAISHPLLHAAIPVPRTYLGYTIPTLLVQGDGSTVGTELISDMDGIALWQYRLGYADMITRTIVSTALKEGASIAATAVTYNTVRNNSSHRGDAELAAAAVYLATDIYRQSQNIADTRSWETLPSNFQAALIKMPNDRRVRIGTDNQTWAEVAIPDTARSAIIYVHCLNNGQLRHILLPK